MSTSWKQLLFQTVLLLVSCRPTQTKTSSPTPPPLVPSSPLSSDVRSVVLQGEGHTEKVELVNPVDLELECIWSGNLNNLPNVTGYWRKDGDEIENSRLAVQPENEKYRLRRLFRIVGEENLGNYSCVFGNEAKVDFILAVQQMAEAREKPIVSYVGDSVVVACKTDGTKPNPLSWNWFKANGTEKEQIFEGADSHRYEIKSKEWTTKLVVHNLTEAESGFFYCEAVYAIGAAMGKVELKVITLWEPLKPFIAILVEVIVLVAAILLYERSQSKKKSSGENETNGEQLNTLTQGENNGPEESSSTRQRKV